MAKKKSKKNGSSGNHAHARAANRADEPRAVAAFAAAAAPESLSSADAAGTSVVASSISVVALNESDDASAHAPVSMLSAEAGCPSVDAEDPLSDVFTALELDFFRRAEELYATSFERWEDFDKDPN